MHDPGEFVLTGIPSKRITASIERRLRNLRPSGVVLFRRNIGTPAEVADLTGSLRRVLGRNCLVAIDQEGGRVARLQEGFTRWPAMRALGELPGTHDARRVGLAMGRELAALGIDINFAPVLDVDSNPANPVIGDRAFSDDPGRVSRLGRAFAEGMLGGGILPCGKHFPGHGDTSTDSHLTLPKLGRSRAALASMEWPPFRAAVRADFPLLLSAHVVYDALDPETPATFSKIILQGLLREDFGFDGALASDDLAMKALAGHGVGTRAVRAFEAGCDLLLACQKLSDGEAAGRALSRFRADAPAATTCVRRSRGRLRVLRQKLADLRRTRERVPLSTVLAENAVLAEKLQLRLERRRGAAGASPRTKRARLRR